MGIEPGTLGPRVGIEPGTLGPRVGIEPGTLGPRVGIEPGTLWLWNLFVLHSNAYLTELTWQVLIAGGVNPPEVWGGGQHMILRIFPKNWMKLRKFWSVSVGGREGIHLCFG